MATKTPTRVSKKTGSEYRTYNPKTTVEDGITWREFRQPVGINASILERYKRPSRSRKNMGNVVTQRVTFTNRGEVSEEYSWDCGCEDYWHNYERTGPVTVCDHITEQRAENEAARLEARKAMRRNEVAVAAARDYEQLFGAA